MTSEVNTEAAEREVASPARTRTPWRAAFFALAVLGLIGGVAWALLGSKLLVVRSVVVSGTHMVPRSEVLAAADVPLGTPLIRVNTALVARRVDAIRQVESAQVSKAWPDRLVITVHERTAAVALRAPGGYYLLDRSGVVVRWTAARPALPLYLTRLPVTSLRGDPAVAGASAVLAGLPPWLSRLVAGVAVPSQGEVTLHLRGAATVVWGDTDRAGAKAKELAILMREHARYYDVSAPGTVVTR
ncbi:MAG: FtsQ-type POTRA domain-containing protein [Streptosporangiaceae bacterium]|nr:FtsQ-type POTRA domain-containing protein [Streptosporangiaceae bacterium]MBV9857681.1 FtsQ-type POTRA domain-containing protein [Streptosporangiaceae bacterium]